MTTDSLLFTSLQALTGASRDNCLLAFGGEAKVKADIVAVCHEVRSASLAPGETIQITFQVAGQREVCCELKQPALLRGVRLEEAMLLGIWAVQQSSASEASATTSPATKRRACGELRIPLRHMVAKYDSMLYQSWVVLESPGLSDSVASMGLGGISEAFANALAQGPKQLFQPKACISACKAAEVGTSGEVHWSIDDVSRRDRVARWGALLRSQQQHVLMCTAQRLQNAQVQREQRQVDVPSRPSRLGIWEESAAEQARELEELREQCRMQQHLEESREVQAGSGGGAERSAATQRALLAQRSLGAQLQGEITTLREEFERISDEANDKVVEANRKIRALRQERDTAAEEVKQKEANLRKLRHTQKELTDETQKLTTEYNCMRDVLGEVESRMKEKLSSTTRKSIEKEGFNFHA